MVYIRVTARVCVRHVCNQRCVRTQNLPPRDARRHTQVPIVCSVGHKHASIPVIRKGLRQIQANALRVGRSCVARATTNAIPRRNGHHARVPSMSNVGWDIVLRPHGHTHTHTLQKCVEANMALLVVETRKHLHTRYTRARARAHTHTHCARTHRDKTLDYSASPCLPSFWTRFCYVLVSKSSWRCARFHACRGTTPCQGEEKWRADR